MPFSGLVILTIDLFFKEGGESINKDLKSFQLNHSPQTGPVERLTATFDRIMDRSDPEVLRNYNKAYQQRAQRAKSKYSYNVLALCKLPKFDFAEVTMYEVDSSDDEN